MTEDEDEKLRLAREIADSYRGAGAPARKKRPKKGPRPTSGRQDLEDPVQFGDVIGNLVHQQGWGSQVAASRVFSDWAQIVGPEVAKHSKVEDFTDGVVKVRTSSTAWATELKLLAPRLVAKLNAELGEGQVQRVEVRGPQAPSWKKGRLSVKGRGPRDTYG